MNPNRSTNLLNMKDLLFEQTGFILIKKYYYSQLNYYQYKIYKEYKILKLFKIRIKSETYDSISSKRLYTNLLMNSNYKIKEKYITKN